MNAAKEKGEGAGDVMDGKKDEAEPRGVFALADEQIDNVETIDNLVAAPVAARADAPTLDAPRANAPQPR
jgi:hypothetical protein